MEIRALREADERSAFRSGDPDLDRFFHRFAAQNQFRHYLGVTYVALEGERILGFATVAPGHVEIDGLPAATRRKLPRYPLPVLRLARLAVDGRAQGQGLGRQLLRFVLQLAARMAGDFGCAGVVVDAKRDAVEFYAKHGFIALEAVHGQSDARPRPTAMFLAMRAIRSASEDL
ncbi:MAG: GNAT family N-acetyltransferase [Burkholderiales bacterium]